MKRKAGRPNVHGKTLQVAFRLPVTLVEQIDRYAERLRAEQPGIGITRADVVRLILVRALADEDGEDANRDKDSNVRKRRTAKRKRTKRSSGRTT